MNFFKEKILGLKPEKKTFVVELPSDVEKRVSQRIRLQDEKIRDLTIQNRKFQEKLKKIDFKKKELKERKKFIKQVYNQLKKSQKTESKKKIIFKKVYPDKPVFLQYDSGERRELEGMEIEQTANGTPIYYLKVKYNGKSGRIQMPSTDFQNFFKSNIGLVEQFHTGIIPLNMALLNGVPVFIKEPLASITDYQAEVVRKNRKIAEKNKIILNLRSQIGSLNEIQADQETQLADEDMALRKLSKERDNFASMTEVFMQKNTDMAKKLTTLMAETQGVEAEQVLTNKLYNIEAQANDILRKRLAEVLPEDVIRMAREDVRELLHQTIKDVLTIQAGTSEIKKTKEKEEK